MRPDTGALVVWFALLPLVSSLILNVLRDRLPDAAISAIFGFVLVGALWLERQRIAWRRLQQLDEQRDREQRAVIAHVENLRRDADEKRRLLALSASKEVCTRHRPRAQAW